jgi:rubrerythrin
MFGKKKTTVTRQTHLFRRDEFVCGTCGYRANKKYKTCPRCGRGVKKVKKDTGWFDEMQEFDDIFE